MRRLGCSGIPTKMVRCQATSIGGVEPMLGVAFAIVDKDSDARATPPELAAAIEDRQFATCDLLVLQVGVDTAPVWTLLDENRDEQLSERDSECRRQGACGAVPNKRLGCAGPCRADCILKSAAVQPTTYVANPFRFGLT